MRLTGVLLALLGAGVLAYGIAAAVGQSAGIGDDAVARGQLGSEVAFESRDPGLTVYLDQSGFGGGDVSDQLSAATSCTVTARGFERSFSGLRQGTAATLGRWVSVGSFSLPGSSGRIRCTGPDLPFVVTPHGTGEAFASIGGIVLGAFVLGGGIVLLAVGYFRRRRSAPSRSSSAPTGSPTTLR